MSDLVQNYVNTFEIRKIKDLDSHLDCALDPHLSLMLRELRLIRFFFEQHLFLSKRDKLVDQKSNVKNFKRKEIKYKLGLWNSFHYLCHSSLK